MNAGAYGKEMKDIVLETTYMDRNGDIYKANNLEQQYPNLDLRIWDINLKSMKIETKSKCEEYLNAIINII